MTRVGVENEVSSCFCITSRRRVNDILAGSREEGVLGLLSGS